MASRIVFITAARVVAIGVLLTAADGVDAAFPDAHDAPPPGWTGPVFRLRQDYPTTRPAVGTQPWRAFDFRTQPVEYLNAVLAYCLEGNVDVDFAVDQNSVRNWYHAPWMHAGANGREFMHGLTHERSSRPRELHPNQSSIWQNWAVSAYNAPGGYVIGQVWKDPNAPDPRKAVFPNGTVAFKLLFTTASVNQVPYLHDAFEWQADLNRASGNGARTTVRLLQIDVAVRDTRASSATGWVFGTFVYDGDANGATPFARMVPVGLMWGNDPTKVLTTATPVQTKLNGALEIPQHLGFRGRLNGPVDNPISSCLSCHSTAQMPMDLRRPTRSGVPPSDPTDAELKLYFRNVRARQPFDSDQISLGYSLQLQNGIANWAQANRPLISDPIGSAAPRLRAPHKLEPQHGVRVRAIGRAED